MGSAAGHGATPRERAAQTGAARRAEQVRVVGGAALISGSTKSCPWRVRGRCAGRDLRAYAARADGLWGGPCIPSTFRCQNVCFRSKPSAQSGLKQCLWLFAEQISLCGLGRSLEASTHDRKVARGSTGLSKTPLLFHSGESLPGGVVFFADSRGSRGLAGVISDIFAGSCGNGDSGCRSSCRLLLPDKWGVFKEATVGCAVLRKRQPTTATSEPWSNLLSRQAVPWEAAANSNKQCLCLGKAFPNLQLAPLTRTLNLHPSTRRRCSRTTEGESKKGEKEERERGTRRGREGGRRE